MTAGQQEKLQMLREEKLAANLKALLRRWVEGDQTGFRVSLQYSDLFLERLQASTARCQSNAMLQRCRIDNQTMADARSDTIILQAAAAKSKSPAHVILAPGRSAWCCISTLLQG